MPCPPPGNLPNPGMEPRSLALQVDSLLSKPPGKPILLLVRFISVSDFPGDQGTKEKNNTFSEVMYLFKNHLGAVEKAIFKMKVIFRKNIMKRLY